MMKILILMFLIFCFPVHATLPSITGNDLIHETCKHTPYYELCVWCLVSDPQSFHADVEGLAKIMIHAIELKATYTLDRINKLLGGKLDSDVKEALQSCADRYDVILKGDIPQALGALRSGDYKFAIQGTADAAGEAMSCEEEISSTGKSRLADLNVVVHHVSAVAESIVEMVI